METRVNLKYFVSCSKLWKLWAKSSLATSGDPHNQIESIKNNFHQRKVRFLKTASFLYSTPSRKHPAVYISYEIGWGKSSGKKKETTQAVHRVVLLSCHQTVHHLCPVQTPCLDYLMIIRDQGSQNEKEWVIQILQKNQAEEHPQMFDSSLEKKKRFWKLTEPM